MHAPTVVRRVMEGALRVDLEARAVRLRRYTCDAPRPREVSGDERAASREWSGHPPVFEESARRTVGIDGARTLRLHGAEGSSRAAYSEIDCVWNVPESGCRRYSVEQLLARS